MEIAEFWSIIDRSRERATKRERDQSIDFLNVHITTLTEVLCDLPPNELMSFREHFSNCLDLAYRWDLWGAAYWLFGGCSDDGFWNFRACLISLGKDRFARVLQDPDHVTDIEGEPDVPYLKCEGFQYVASRVYQERTGEDMPPREQSPPNDPKGDAFEFDSEQEMARRFPKLVAKYPEMGD